MKYSLLLPVILLGVAAPAIGQNYRFEAENGALFGTYVANSVSGYSGTGYVTGFDGTLNGGDYFQLQANVPDGLYELWVGYRSQYGEKGYTYQVDDEFGSGMFDGSTTFSVDRAGVFNLTGGTNTLGIYQNWGYYDVDYLELRPFTPPPVSPVPSKLVDPLATRNTQLLMNYMTSLYGSKTLSGNQGQVGQNDPFPTQDYLNRSGGLVPAIRGSDFIDYSPSRVERYDNRNNETERMIDWAHQTGGVVSMMWHWNAPTDLIDQPGEEWWRGFYTDATTFDLPGALANPGGEDYQLLLRDIDTIGAELQKFQDADVPVIWRPLHEAQGGWFWWGAHGPEAFKDLWHLMYDRLTNVDGLHNLIWEYTSSAAEGDFLDWYPGDDEVDIVGLDIYTDPSSSMSGQWYDILQEYDGKKLVALSETGTLPSPDALDAYGIDWSYISPWTWDFVESQYADAGYTPAQLTAALQALLGDDNVITLDELMTMPWSVSAPALPGDYNDDGTVDAADYTLWRDTMEAGGTTLANDLTPGAVDEFDFQVWRDFFGQTLGGGAGAAAVPEPASWLLLCWGALLLQRWATIRFFAPA
jgi:mannan endo-1,4-beta-mannosidase